MIQSSNGQLPDSNNKRTFNLTAIMQLTHNSFFSPTILLFSLLLLLQSITAVESATSSTWTTHKTTLDNFIKKSCQVTLYSDLCYTSLSSYTGDPDLGKLTYAAIRVGLIEGVHTKDYLAGMSGQSPTKANDCMELTEEAVWHVKKSVQEMASILRSNGAQWEGEGEKKKRRFEMSNVQTWMSAAITDQRTCMDGFNNVDGGRDDEEMKITEGSRKVDMTVKLMSNALALVNSFVDATS